tara:strand:+ start:3667 stop:4458 length:792 start_codon:yes stop_codon:yes gene_type:complete
MSGKKLSLKIKKRTSSTSSDTLNTIDKKEKGFKKLNLKRKNDNLKDDDTKSDTKSDTISDTVSDTSVDVDNESLDGNEGSKKVKLSFRKTNQSLKYSSVDAVKDRTRIKNKFCDLVDNKQLGENIEREMHKSLVDLLKIDFPEQEFRREYLSKAYNLLQNLNPNGSIGNNYLADLVKSGKVKPEKLVKMTDHEMYPPKWDKIKNRRLKEIQSQNELTEATSDLYQCFKCGKRETTFFQRQTRSQDEPMTSFIKCVNCGTRWKD